LVENASKITCVKSYLREVSILQQSSLTAQFCCGEFIQSATCDNK